MRAEYKQLRLALDAAATAKQHVRENRGYDKELAKESYDHVVAEQVVPAMTAAVEYLAGDLDTSDVVRLAAHIAKLIEKKKV